MKRWIVPLVALAGLVPLQHLGLDKTPERREERRYWDLSNLPPTRALETYVWGVLLGSFRSVAIVSLRLQYEDARDHHRYEEAIEYGTMILRLQPRNSEVWNDVAWDFLLSMPKQALEPEEKWGYARQGYLLMADGNRANPASPFFAYNKAFLLHKPAVPGHGIWVEEFVRRFLADPELQRPFAEGGVVLEPDPEGRPITPFRAADQWYRRAGGLAREEMERRGVPYLATPGGVVVMPYRCDLLALRDGVRYDGFWAWREGEPARGIEIFREAQGRCRELLERYGRHGHFENVYDEPWFYEDLIRIVEHQAAAREGLDREGMLALYGEVHSLLLRYPGADDRLLAFLLAHDLLAALGADRLPWPRNYRAAHHYRTGSEWFGEVNRAEPVTANLVPVGIDADWFDVLIPALPGAPSDTRRPAHIEVKVQAPAGMSLHVAIYEGERKMRCGSVPAGGTASVVHEGMRPQVYVVCIAPGEIRDPAADSTYRVWVNAE